MDFSTMAVPDQTKPDQNCECIFIKSAFLERSNLTRRREINDITWTQFDLQMGKS